MASSATGFPLGALQPKTQALITLFEFLSNEWIDFDGLSDVENETSIDMAYYLLARRKTEGATVRMKLTSEGRPIHRAWMAGDYQPLIQYLATAPQQAPDLWTEIRPPDHWESVFGLSWRTIKRMNDAGDILMLEVNSKAWRVWRGDLPTPE